MTVKLSTQMEKEITVLSRDYGYKNKTDFIKDALKHRILDLKKAEFLAITDKIRKKMKKRGLTEKDILIDFEKSRY